MIFFVYVWQRSLHVRDVVEGTSGQIAVLDGGPSTTAWAEDDPP
jgi:hypothetical protein